MTNRIAAAAFGAAALLGAAMSGSPASAAPIAAAPALATGADTGLVQQVWHYGRPHYGRPVYRPRCVWTHRRVWTPRGWVVRRVRVCR
ncbi:hypothetical protein [Bosea thiooxidans]